MQEDLFRIIDANFNRVRESMRVLEDFCRFSLDSKVLSGAFKGLRHDLSQMLTADADFARKLLERRDNIGDVGIDLTCPHEEARANVKSIASAAFKRTEEGLRVIEETLKAAKRGDFSRVEKISYEIYRLEKVVESRTHQKEKLGSAKLYLLFTVSMIKGDYLQAARSAIEGGVDIIQLREKETPDRLFLAYARALRTLTEEAGVLFIVNDRVDIAELCGADGVHLGQEDLGINEARKVVGFEKIIGMSTRNLEQAREAERAGADYIGIGPIFETSVKPETKPTGLGVIEKVSGEIGIPVFPLGGINADNIDEVVKAGGTRAAVCSAILCAEEIRSAAEEIKSRLM